MKAKLIYAIPLLSFMAAILLSIWTISSPAPKDTIDGFSAEQAYSHLEAIAQKQHSVFDVKEIEEVRNYLEETIDAFENVRWTRIKHSQIEVFNHKTQAKEPIDINNIYAEIPGTSGRYLLLVAHFDSCPYKEKYGVATDGSYGAADDGYGLATMLEIMRLLNDYSAKNKLVNGVKFAFTDAEEVALGGAAALIKEFSYWLKDVNIVLNLEARGNKGPLYMFQTGDNNYRLIDFYRHARLPFSFSIAAEVYQHLPNDTDFTPFLKAGYTGLNFATLNSLKYYHTPNDNLQNAHKPTLQFYGEQVYPLVQAYINNERYSDPKAFESNSNAV
ncbi:MAG: M20/M25/M40 family metallo-hydrolase, partial [Bacteroidetes bacterium]|nr:M20/M25/M40 family metallo-hydrolase [Bacteroidota bacterium]